MIDMNKNTFSTKYEKFITGTWEDTNTVILSDTDTSIGQFKKSDIFAKFSPDGKCCIVCERTYKEDYGELEWTQLALRANSRVYNQKQFNGICTSCTYEDDYIDFITYREEWLDWSVKSSGAHAVC